MTDLPHIPGHLPGVGAKALPLPAGFPLVETSGPRDRAIRAAERRQRETDRIARSKLSGALPDVPFLVSVAGVSFRDPTFVDAVGLTWLKMQAGAEVGDVLRDNFENNREALENELGAAAAAAMAQPQLDGVGATLIREPDNEHDANAVAIWLHTDYVSDKIGFVPAPLAIRLAREMDAGEVYEAKLVRFDENPANPMAPLVDVELRRVDVDEYWDNLEDM